MGKSIEQSIVRIRDAKKRIVGSGFCLNDNLVLTCAHVVNQALERPPDETELPAEAKVLLDFPLVDSNQIISAQVVDWDPPLPGGFGDIAWLEIEGSLPDGARATFMTRSEDLWHHHFRAFGFSKGYDDGVWAYGRILGRNATGWLQIEDEKETGYFVAPGFSGAPVWDEDLGSVVGMVVAADTTPGVRAAFIIPANILDKDSELELKKSAHVFVSYKRNANPDERLANLLDESLRKWGHTTFIDNSLRTGDAWLEKIDREIQASDFLVVFLSGSSANSQMIQAEVMRAYEYQKLQSRPQILPVRVAYQGLVPYTIAAFLNPLQYVVWQNEADDERVCSEIAAAIMGNLPIKEPIKHKPANELVTVSEDGDVIMDENTMNVPLPEFDARFLYDLEAPGGAVKLRDKLYVERDADQRLKQEVLKSGTTTSIRAPRQTGKSSLLLRGLNFARQQGAEVVLLDLQRVDQVYFSESDRFLRYLAEFVVRKLQLDIGIVESSWRGSLGPQDKLTYLFEDYILPERDAPIILAMDEADRLLQVSLHEDFFGLLRSWHNTRAVNELWDRLNIVLVISTEPYLLIKDINQSPFNVGLRLNLSDFDDEQVRSLNQRHGSPVENRDIPELMNLLGGHPYLTRKALYTMVTEGIGWSDLARTATTDQGPFGDHLRRFHWLLQDEPDLKTTLRQIIRYNRCDDDMSVFRLLRSGLIYSMGEVCRCRCKLYQAYFEDKL